MASEFLEEGQLESLVETLIGRESNSMKFPDKLYALGGAGKSITFEVLESDWFLIELLLHHERNDIEFHLIDTATESKIRDHEKKQRIEDQIGRIEEILEANGHTETPRIRIKLAHLTDEVPTSKIAHFVNEERVRNILRHSHDEGANHWWVDKESLVDSGGDMHNLAKGAIRRRALSKAFFYKAQTESNFSNDHLNLMNDDQQIAIIAGLGGGTGSGMFLDLARYIADEQESARLTMFGILPSTTEGGDEKANAHAALCELEHLALNASAYDERFPFADVVLSPIDATEHNPGIDNNPKLRNFDSAYPYVLLTFYNHEDLENPFKSDHRFSPFTVAIPQVYRYNVQEIQQNRDKIKRLLEKKAESLRAEEQLYSRINNFIQDHYGDIEGGQLTQSDADQIKERISIIKEFANDEMIGGSRVNDYLTTVFDTEQERDQSLAEDVNDMRFAVDNDYSQQTVDSESSANPYIDDTSEEHPDDLEQPIINRINEEMRRVLTQYDIRRKNQWIDQQGNEEEVKRLISFLLDINEGQEAAKKQDREFREAINDVNELLDRKNHRLTTLERDLEQAKENQQQRIETLVGQWSSQVEKPLDRLEVLESLDVKDDDERLRTQLNGFANRIRTTSKEDVSTLGTDIDETLNSLEQRFNEASVNAFAQDKQSIKQVIKQVREARKRWIDAKDNGLIETLRRLVRGGETGAYESIASTINNNRVFNVPTDPQTHSEFQVELVFQPKYITAIRDERKAIKNTLVQVFDELLTKEMNAGLLSNERKQRYKDAITADVDSYTEQNERRTILKEIVKEAITDRVSNINDIKEEISRVKEEIQTLENRKNRLEAGMELFQTAADEVTTFRAGHREFKTKLQESSHPSEGGNEHDEYVRVVNPPEKNVSKKSLSETEWLTNDHSERRDVQEHFENCVADKFTNTTYNGLVERSLDTSDKMDLFEKTVLNVALAGDAFAGAEHGIRQTLFETLTKKLKNELDINEGSSQADRFGNWAVSNGGPWDAAMCVFLQGICFLDNLDPAVSPSKGYLEAYNHKKKDTSPIVRHAFGLERGFYVNREDSIPVNDNKELFIRSSDGEIVQQILEQHECVEVTESTDADENVDKQTT